MKLLLKARHDMFMSLICVFQTSMSTELRFNQIHQKRFQVRFTLIETSAKFSRQAARACNCTIASRFFYYDRRTILSNQANLDLTLIHFCLLCQNITIEITRKASLELVRQSNRRSTLQKQRYNKDEKVSPVSRDQSQKLPENMPDGETENLHNKIINLMHF